MKKTTVDLDVFLLSVPVAQGVDYQKLGEAVDTDKGAESVDKEKAPDSVDVHKTREALGD